MQTVTDQIIFKPVFMLEVTYISSCILKILTDYITV